MATMRCAYKWPVGKNWDAVKGCRVRGRWLSDTGKETFRHMSATQVSTKNLHFSKTTQIGPWTPGNVTQGILYCVLSVPLEAGVQEGRCTASKELAAGDVFLKLKPSQSMVLSSLSVISQWNWSEAQSTEWSGEVCPAKVLSRILDTMGEMFKEEGHVMQHAPLHFTQCSNFEFLNLIFVS